MPQVPYLLVFNLEGTEVTRWLESVGFVLYALDVVLGLTTSEVDEIRSVAYFRRNLFGEFMSNHLQCICTYCLRRDCVCLLVLFPGYIRGWMLFDVISALPYRALAEALFAVGITKHKYYALLLLRITKIIKLPRLMRSVQGTSLVPSA